jgi:hypothetical protein
MGFRNEKKLLRRQFFDRRTRGENPSISLCGAEMRQAHDIDGKDFPSPNREKYLFNLDFDHVTGRAFRDNLEIYAQKFRYNRFFRPHINQNYIFENFLKLYS